MNEEEHQVFLELLSAVSKEDSVAALDRSKRVEQINKLAKVIRSSTMFCCQTHMARKIVESLQYTLMSSMRELRAGALRLLRYILISRDIFQIMLDHCIDSLILRCMDLSSQRDVERVQALRFMQQVIIAAPDLFPMSFGLLLVSIATGDADDAESFTWSCIGLLCQLMLCNVAVAVSCGAIRKVCWRILSTQNIQLSESVVMVLLHQLSSPASRQYLRPGSELLSLLAPLTDIHYQHSVDSWEEAKKIHFLSSLHNTRDDDFKMKVESSCMVTKTILSSWSGVMLMVTQATGGRKSALSAVINVLPLLGVSSQVEVIEMLYGVFQLRMPTWTDSFAEALASIDSRHPRSDWSLSEGFVAEEALSLLPPTTTGRPNLVKCHMALLLSFMLDLDLFSSISHICLGENIHLATRATILLGELSHLANKHLPDQSGHSVQSMPEIVTAAMDFSDGQRRGRANAVISCLDNLHKMKKRGKKPSSLFLSMIYNQGSLFKQAAGSIPRDIDEGSLTMLIKSSQVTASKDYKQWDWNLLQSMLRVEPYCYKKVEEALKLKFFKRLHEFYKPESKHFSSIAYSPAASWKYSGVGCLLIRFLARDEELITFLPGMLDIVSEMEEVSKQRLSAYLSPYNLEHTLCRDYFLFLGCVSHHKPSILLHCHAYGAMFSLCELDMRVDLHKLVLSSLDFSRDRFSRALLSKLLTAGAAQTRLYATKMLRVLLRSRAQVFKSWGIEMLTTQLYDPDEDIAAEALDVLDEACEEESYLISLIQFNPALLHLSDKGVTFFTRFFSTRKGLNRMRHLGYLDGELTRWHTAHNRVYARAVEDRLTKAFTSYRDTKEEFVKRNITGDAARQPALVPVHLYSQLACHDEGCDILEQTGFVSQYSNIIRKNIASCSADISQVKATVWAVAHIGTSVGGLELLMDEGVVHDLVRMAETNNGLTVRGTCFYALCLIARTVQGADILQQLGWTSLRHTINSSPLTEAALSSSDLAGYFNYVSPLLSPLESLFQPSENQDVESLLPETTDVARLSTIRKNTNQLKKDRILKRVQAIERSSSEKLMASTNLLQNLEASSGGTESLLPPDLPPSGNVQAHKRRLSLSFTSRHTQGVPEEEDASLAVNGHSGSTSDILDSNASDKAVPKGRSGQMQSPLLLSTSAASPYGTASRAAGKKLIRLTSSRKDSISTTSSAPISFYRPNYVGICLPKNKLSLLQIPPVDFKGAQSGFILPELDNPSGEGLRHIPARCLECRWRETAGGPDPAPVVDMTDCDQEGVELSDVTPPLLSGQDGPSNLSNEKILVRKETLRIVIKLSSDVASTANKQGLKLLFSRFPWAAQDVCLYSQVLHLLSTYLFPLNHRRFVQDLFRKCQFKSVFESRSQELHTPLDSKPSSHDHAHSSPNHVHAPAPSDHTPAPSQANDCTLPSPTKLQIETVSFSEV